MAVTLLLAPVRETDSLEEPVHGSAKQGVVAVRSPEWVVPEGTSSGRALFFCPARKPWCALSNAEAIALYGVTLSRLPDFARPFLDGDARGGDSEITDFE